MDLTLFLGEPEYDNNGTIVGRKLGVQNMIAWLFIGLVGYQLMCRGGKKQKGGDLQANLEIYVGCYVVFFFLLWAIIWVLQKQPFYQI